MNARPVFSLGLVQPGCGGSWRQETQIGRWKSNQTDALRRNMPTGPFASSGDRQPPQPVMLSYALHFLVFNGSENVLALCS
jgi:hypothetical protein